MLYCHNEHECDGEKEKEKITTQASVLHQAQGPPDLCLLDQSPSDATRKAGRGQGIKGGHAKGAGTDAMRGDIWGKG